MHVSDLADDSIRISETRYRRLFETACDGILLLNAQTGQIEDVNPYLVKMLGYSHAEFLGEKALGSGYVRGHSAEQGNVP